MRPLALFCLFLSLYPAAPNATAQATSAPRAGVAVCVEGDSCTTWLFVNGHVAVQWPNKAAADLTLDSLTPSAIKVTRKDTSGPAKGLTFEYVGSIAGWVIQGTLSSPAKPAAIAKWQGIVLPMEALSPKQPAPAPTGWIECEDPNGSCSGPHPPATFAWAVGMPRDSTRALFHATNDPIGVLKFDSDTASKVVIRKLDVQGDYAGSGTIYTGTRQGPLMRGAYLAIIPGQPHPVQGTWLAEITSKECTPASQAVHPTVSYFDVGIMNLMLGDEKSAIHCWEVGHKKDEAESEAMLSRVYYNGGPYTPKNLEMSFEYSQAAAIHGDLEMMHNTAEMHRLGEGTPVDHLRAGYWNDVEDLRKQEIRDAATLNRSTNGLEAIDAMLTSAFLHQITFADQALRGRLEHRSDVLRYMGSGQTRVEAEDNATRDEIASRQKYVDECKDRHEEEREAAARASGKPMSWIDTSDACGASIRDLNSYSSGSEKYLACVHKFVDSEAIEANCHY